MASTYKVLAQLRPMGPYIPTTLYTCGSANGAVISTLSICSLINVDSTVSVAVRPAGATLDPKHYIMYNAPVAAADSLNLTLGLTLANTDVITVSVYAAGNAFPLSFSLFGSELT